MVAALIASIILNIGLVWRFRVLRAFTLRIHTQMERQIKHILDQDSIITRQLKLLFELRAELEKTTLNFNKQQQQNGKTKEGQKGALQEE